MKRRQVSIFRVFIIVIIAPIKQKENENFCFTHNFKYENVHYHNVNLILSLTELINRARTVLIRFVEVRARFKTSGPINCGSFLRRKNSQTLICPLNQCPVKFRRHHSGRRIKCNLPHQLKRRTTISPKSIDVQLLLCRFSKLNGNLNGKRNDRQ